MKNESIIIGILGIFLLIQPIGAQTWTATKRLTWLTGESQNPAEVVDSADNIHVVWQDDSEGSSFEIFYKRSTDGGTTWPEYKRLTWNAGGSYVPAIAAGSSSTIHVVWYDYSPGNGEIYYKRSTNGGVTWESSRRITWTSGSSYAPAIAVDSMNTVHVLWRDNTNDSNDEIYYKQSTDGGTTWSNNKRLTWNAGDSHNPAIAVDSTDKIHVAWNDDSRGSSMEIFYRRSVDGGISWSKLKRFTWNSGHSVSPELAAGSGNNVHIVWFDSTPGNGEIYYKRSTNAGVTWESSRRLTWNSSISTSPTIAVDSSSGVHFAWQDYSKDSNFEILFRRSTDGGTTWTKYKRLTWNAEESRFPSIDVDSSNNIHLVWDNETSGADEIYYRKGIQ
jgi:hypothetical protein